MLLISLFVVSFFTLSSAKSFSLESQWESFKQIHGKSYSSVEEELHRKSVFEKNLAFIEQHNKEADKGIHTYRLGITSFADLNADEIPKKNLNIDSKPRDRKIIRKKTYKSKEELPKSVDWRTKGIVTRVKDQGQGPYCSYFAGIAAVEAAYAQKTGKHINLSEQNVIDCSTSLYKPESAVQWVFTHAKYEGIVLEHCYPYVERSHKTCKVNETNCERYKINDYYRTNFEDEEEMAAAVAEHVVTTELYVNNYFYYYNGGILNPPGCNKGFHSVAIVGYGTENGLDYWIFKNSWGPHWGENGFGRILRGNRTCDIGIFGAEGVILN